MIDTEELRRLISSEGTDYNDLCIDLVTDIVPALCDEIEYLRGLVKEMKRFRGVEQLVAPQILNLTVEGSSPSTPAIHSPVRVLCMCEGGHNRSGALALQLKQRGVDAIQIGWRHNTAETINHFVEWADFVIKMQPWDPATTKIDSVYAEKVRVLDVGPDVWGSNTHMELNRLVAPFVEEWIQRGWDI